MVDETTMQLQIKIFTGEVTEKYLANLRVRAGNIIGVSESQTRMQGRMAVRGGQEDDRVLREEPVNASRAQTPGESGSAAPFGGFVSNTL